MSDRQFKDCDGDTWTEYEPGKVRLTARADGSDMYLGCTDSLADVQGESGPLTEIRPDVDVRALLAGVLNDMADGAREAFMETDDVSEERVYGKVAYIFDRKARELRELRELREESA
ncbi:hypothetical protein [Streptomyces fulvorobeus]|uniref:Uncharacterized protein n=1 Tax=Streptomyces fulvorobeus TaxID=284028 RepID=A0A7J0CGB1_9ACTN|nr:hypothetical protein [Streptomyces fulvorobeus]NYE44242.1 hypothetical protein [Streptomyces fulvorobeus]GFN00757.1 hypothetical protein Sfulv_55670 [Streptomyces fulvorobeus]